MCAGMSSHGEEKADLSLSLKRKIEIIAAAEANPTKKKKIIAAEFGVAPSTLTGILKDAEKYK